MTISGTTRDLVIPGSNLTHCSAEYGPGQAAGAHVPVVKQYNLVLVEGW